MRRKEEEEMREDMDGKVQGLGGLHTLFLNTLVHPWKSCVD